MIVDVLESIVEQLGENLAEDFKEGTAALAVTKSDAEQITAFLSERAKESEAKLLSQPGLQMLAGTPCEFLAGGEAPIMVPSGAKETAIEFKPFGIHARVTCSPMNGEIILMNWRVDQTQRRGNQTFSGQSTEGTHRIRKGESLLIVSPSRETEKSWTVTLLRPQLANPQPMNASPVASTTSALPEPVASPVPYAHFTTPGPTNFDFGPAADRAEINSHEASSISIRSGVQKTLELKDGLKVAAVEGQTVKIESESRIKQVRGFDSELLQVEPVQGNAQAVRLHMLKNGATTLFVVDAHNERHRVPVLIKGSDKGLSQILERLYPNLQLKVWNVKGSVLLRGNVVSEKQSQQIINIAEEFFPLVLNQLEVRPQAAHNAPECSIIEPQGREFTIRNSESTLFVDRKYGYTLKCPQKVQSVYGFDEECVRIESVQRKADQVTLLAVKTGATRVTLEGADGGVYELRVVVQDDTAHLSSLIAELYPDDKLSFFPLNGAVLLRGRVASAEQVNEIVQLAEQFFPNVLNHLEVGGLAASTSDPGVDGPGPGVIRQVGLPSTERAPAADRVQRSDVNVIRQDIRSLHGDVRQLMELLQRRKKDNEETPQDSASTKLPERGVLFFTADRCAPCRKMEQLIAEIEADEPKSWVLHPVNVSQSPKLASRFQVDRIPSFVAILDGKEVARAAGVQSTDDIWKLMKRVGE